MASTMMNMMQRKSKLVSRPALNGRRVAFAPTRNQRNVRMNVADELVEFKNQYVPEWPNKEFVAAVLADFPDEKAIATVEEARCLYENGWTYLDVRPTLEVEQVGKVKNSVNIPIMNAKYQYDPESKERVVKKTENPDFVKMVERRFPNKEAKLLVACSDGRSYSITALETLEEAGYENMAALKGGYYAWFRTFDNKLGRRRSGEYAEKYGHSGDSCGIHSSGAGFEKMDAQDRWVPPKF